MRIEALDCDYPFPTFKDSEARFKNVVLNVKELYASSLHDFETLWLDLLPISEGLHKVLNLRYRSTLSFSPKPRNRNTEIRALPLFSLSTPPSKFQQANRTLITAIHDLNLHRLALQIALLRPPPFPHPPQHLLTLLKHQNPRSNNHNPVPPLPKLNRSNSSVRRADNRAIACSGALYVSRYRTIER